MCFDCVLLDKIRIDKSVYNISYTTDGPEQNWGTNTKILGWSNKNRNGCAHCAFDSGMKEIITPIGIK